MSEAIFLHNIQATRRGATLLELIFSLAMITTILGSLFTGYAKYASLTNAAENRTLVMSVTTEVATRISVLGHIALEEYTEHTIVRGASVRLEKLESADILDGISSAAGVEHVKVIVEMPSISGHMVRMSTIATVARTENHNE